MKTSIKKLITPCGAALTTVFFHINSALAASTDIWNNPQGVQAPSAAAQGSFTDNVTRMINYFLGILGLIAVGFLIYSGILMVTAGGNEEQIGKARKIITYAVIGIVIVLLSYTIVTFISSALD